MTVTSKSDPAAVAAAIIADVSSRMPPLAEMTARDADNTDVLDMGPDVTLPAIHMHILVQHIRRLEAQATLAGIELRLARGTSIGLAPDDAGDARAIYAGTIGEVMTRAFAGDHDQAVSTLIHAAAAILATRHDAQVAASALEVGAAMFANEIRLQFAPTGKLQ
jgi:hypothetical protein